MKKLLQTITRTEWRLVWLMAIVMILLTSVPYLIGWLMAKPGFVYDGLHALSPGDIPVYYSYINQVKHGFWLVKDLFTSEVQTGGTFNIWWALVGLLARYCNLSVPLVFQLSRLLMIPVFMVVAYLFISYFLDQIKQRRLALFFLLFASGLGFYVAGPLDTTKLTGTTAYWWPIDLWLTEAVTFNVLYQTSHFIASLTLMLLIFLLVLLAFDYRKFNYALIAGVLSAIYFNFHPYYLPAILGTVGFYWLYLCWLEKKALWWAFGYLTVVTVFSSLPAAYHFWLIATNSVVSQRAIQNVTTISPVFFVLIGYGFLWLGAVLGAVSLIKSQQLTKRYVFLLLWLVTNFILIYSPLPFHSRYVQGVHVILVIFTVIGLVDLCQWLKRKLPPAVYDFWLNNPVLMVILFVVFFGMSNIYSLGRDIYYFVAQTPEAMADLYLPQGLLETTTWLAKQPTGKIILAADVPAKFIPGFSGQTVYLAHAHETLNFYRKAAELMWFFSDTKDDSARFQFLQRQGINYILYSDYEKALGSFVPATKNYLRLVFFAPTVQLYEVIVPPAQD